jgi:hypothetical protein
VYLWPQKFNIYIIGGVVLTAVVRIGIHRIHVLLGLLDPDPLVRGTDPGPDLDPSNIKQNSEKTLDFSFCDFFLQSFA